MSPAEPEHEEFSADREFSILDGAVEGGNPRLRWLPPFVNRAGDVEGAFDPFFLPFITVEVCVWDGDHYVAGPIASLGLAYFFHEEDPNLLWASDLKELHDPSRVFSPPREEV